MPDEIDIVNQNVELERETLIRRARVKIPEGIAGTCTECDEDSPRLVGGRCAPCRDGR